MLKVNSRLSGMNDINGYTDEAHENKEFFHAEGRKFLRDLSKELGLVAGTFEIRSNKAGPAVSGEVTLHADTLYVQLFESYMAKGVQIMFRVCRGRQDYSGGQNHFVTMKDLFMFPHERERFVTKLKNLGGLA